jgi:DNA-binding SARP family transcriptional activator
LQVAISALRQLLDVALVARVGDAYCLTLPGAATVDFQHFDRLLSDARAADAAGDADATVESLESALDLYRGELLPEEGPAEWVVKGRDRFRAAAADGAERLARIRLSQDALPAAVAACQRGLDIDRYRDAIWRMLIEAYRRSGDHAAAAHAQQEYDAVLRELGVESSPATT